MRETWILHFPALIAFSQCFQSQKASKASWLFIQVQKLNCPFSIPYCFVPFFFSCWTNPLLCLFFTPICFSFMNEKLNHRAVCCLIHDFLIKYNNFISITGTVWAWVGGHHNQLFAQENNIFLTFAYEVPAVFAYSLCQQGLATPKNSAWWF